MRGVLVGRNVPCYSPLLAWQLVSGEVIFKERGDIKRELKLACGQCIGCRLERSRQWAIRCMHESQLYEYSSFVTLTYDDEHLGFPSLRYKDFQLFMRRVRKKYGKVRFFMCGEYGELRKRPHFHACLFGLFFHDRKLYSELSSGFKLYTSDDLRDLWRFGFSSVGDVSFESAAYIARYVTKKVFGNAAVLHYNSFPDYSTGELISVVPEFARMSLKPGIGKGWIEKYGKSDVFHRDSVVVRGKECKVPKYYDKFWKSEASMEFEQIEFERCKRADLSADDCRPDRLAVREIVSKARLNFKPRNLE